jgi:hypothetical protein
LLNPPSQNATNPSRGALTNFSKLLHRESRSVNTKELLDTAGE